MNNAEKYKEVFGVEPDLMSCIADRCSNCPLRCCVKIAEDRGVKCIDIVKEWWNSEYKGESKE